MPNHTNLFSWSISGACLFALSACLSDAPPGGPSIAGHFGSRLEGLPPRALLDSSSKALGMMLELSGGTYSYKNGYQSMFAGESHWQVDFRAGLPVREVFASRDIDGKTVRVVETPADWAVPKEARQNPLPDPVPLDSIYAQCRVLLDGCLEPAYPQFTYDRNYILSWCGCHDSRIADGTPSVSLERVDWARK